MNAIDYIAQPSDRTTCEVIDRVLQRPGVKKMDVAAAYITAGGVDILLRIMNDRSCSENRDVVKRWLTSFDYCRTDPIALETLLALPSSAVRIHDAEKCLANRGVPKIPFHPKTFLFYTPRLNYALAGSGNISRSGLSRGFEAGLIIGIDRSSPLKEPTAVAAVDALQRFFTRAWNAAIPLRPALLARYRNLYESAEHLRNAVPTEDDVATSHTSSGSLTNDDLKKLRVCRHFWMEAGNITKNRGPHLPGNQLMMKRLARVFFGFEPTTVPENTLIGYVGISFNRGRSADYSLTYSDNKMDKLVLPIPGSGGPESYDGRYLLFEQTKPKSFRLSLGSVADKKTWLRKSTSINGAFRMSSGREWGVF